MVKLTKDWLEKATCAAFNHLLFKPLTLKSLNPYLIQSLLNPVTLQFVSPELEQQYGCLRSNFYRNTYCQAIQSYLILTFGLCLYTTLSFQFIYNSFSLQLLQLCFIGSAIILFLPFYIDFPKVTNFESLPYKVMIIDLIASKCILFYSINITAEICTVTELIVLFFPAIYNGYLCFFMTCRIRSILNIQLTCFAVSSFSVFLANSGTLQIHNKKTVQLALCLELFSFFTSFCGRYAFDLFERIERYSLVKTSQLYLEELDQNASPVLSRGEHVLKLLQKTEKILMNGLSKPNCDRETISVSYQLISDAMQVLHNNSSLHDLDVTFQETLYKSFQDLLERAQIEKQKTNQNSQRTLEPLFLSEAYMNLSHSNETRRASILQGKSSRRRFSTIGPYFHRTKYLSIQDKPLLSTQSFLNTFSLLKPIADASNSMNTTADTTIPSHKTNSDNENEKKHVKKSESDKFTRLTLQEPHTLQDNITEELQQNLGQSVSLNLISLAEHLEHPILTLGSVLMYKYLDTLNISMNRLMRFLLKIEGFYLPNPYHNALHAVAVAHQGLVFLKECGLTEDCPAFGDLEIVAFIIACLGHDAGHPGVTAKWLTETHNVLSVVYNDRSPLEQMHAALTLSIFENPSLNLFINVSPDDFQNLRKRMIEMILSTDMAHSVKYVAKYRMRRTSPDFHPTTNNSDAWFTAIICLKAADLGHSLLPVSQHVSWSLRCLQEFYKQGEAELARNLPVTVGFDKNNHKETLIQSQTFFLVYVAQPVIECLYEASNNKDAEWYKNFKRNRDYWMKGEAYQHEFIIPSNIQEKKTFESAAIQNLINMQITLIKRVIKQEYSEIGFPANYKKLKEFAINKQVPLASSNDSDIESLKEDQTP